MTKRATNLTIDPALLDEARGLGINLSATFEASLRDAVRKQYKARNGWRKTAPRCKARMTGWKNTGMPLAQFRQF